jgi:hypothetical protein
MSGSGFPIFLQTIEGNKYRGSRHRQYRINKEDNGWDAMIQTDLCFDKASTGERGGALPNVPRSSLIATERATSNHGCRDEGQGLHLGADLPQKYAHGSVFGRWAPWLGGGWLLSSSTPVQRTSA